jgi:hypothetical protein
MTCARGPDGVDAQPFPPLKDLQIPRIPHGRGMTVTIGSVAFLGDLHLCGVVLWIRILRIGHVI